MPTTSRASGTLRAVPPRAGAVAGGGAGVTYSEKGGKLAQQMQVGPCMGTALKRLELAQLLGQLGVSLARGPHCHSTLPWTVTHKGKIHRVDPDFGSTLTVSNRGSQPTKLLGQLENNGSTL